VANDFWLYRWIDEYGVESAEDLDALLRPNSAAVARLSEMVAAEEWTALPPYEGSQPAIVAGLGIDLSGDLECWHHECQIRQVDKLFGRVLHYFGEIVVAGPPAHEFVESLDGGSDEDTLRKIGEHARALLYLRAAGAEDMVSFVQKPPACEVHYRQHAEEAGISELMARAGEWVDHLEAGGRVGALDAHEDHWHYRFDHPDMEHTVWGTLVLPGGRTEATIRDVCEAVFGRYSAHLVSDLSAAKQLGLPLGAGVHMHEDALSGWSRSRTIEDVAFHLQLPVLDELPIADIVRVRQDEMEFFHNFRHALSIAIEDRLSADASSQAVAGEIGRDVIEPELARIAARLRAAETTFKRKAGASVAVGALATTVGVVIGAPLVVVAGAAAVGTSLTAAHKYFDDKESVELSDMYFLWRLEEVAAGHGH